MILVALAAAALFSAPEIPKDRGYAVQGIREGLYWVTDGAYNRRANLTEGAARAPNACRRRPPSGMRDGRVAPGATEAHANVVR